GCARGRDAEPPDAVRSRHVAKEGRHLRPVGRVALREDRGGVAQRRLGRGQPDGDDRQPAGRRVEGSDDVDDPHRTAAPFAGWSAGAGGPIIAGARYRGEHMGQRPIVAVVSNALTPYRLALHRRIVRELPAVELWSLFTHGEGDSRWEQGPPADINPVEFGAGERSVGPGGPRRPLREWRKG